MFQSAPTLRHLALALTFLHLPACLAHPSLPSPPSPPNSSISKRHRVLPPSSGCGLRVQPGFHGALQHAERPPGCALSTRQGPGVHTGHQHHTHSQECRPGQGSPHEPQDAAHADDEVGTLWACSQAVTVAQAAHTHDEARM